jgi:hypothetical protein
MSRGAAVRSFPIFDFSLVGPKDLLMPEKTHRRCGRIDRWPGCLLELLRRTVAQRRMQTASIERLFQERLDVRLGQQVILAQKSQH